MSRPRTARAAEETRVSRTARDNMSTETRELYIIIILTKHLLMAEKNSLSICIYKSNHNSVTKTLPVFGKYRYLCCT